MPFDKHEFYRQQRDRLSQQLDSQGVRYWKPKIGTNTIRILPNWSDPVGREFFKQVFIHWNVGEEKKKVVCPSTEGRTDCPICAYVKDLYESKNEDDLKEARELARRERFACNVLDMSGQSEGIAVFELGPQLFRDILWMFTDGDYGDLDDLKNGRNIKIERVGQGKMDTRYSAFPAGKSTEVPAELLDKVPDLDVIYKCFSNDEIERFLVGDSEERTKVGAGGETPNNLEEEEEFAAPVIPAKTQVFTKPLVQTQPEPAQTPVVQPTSQTVQPPVTVSPPQQPIQESDLKSAQSMRGARLRERIQRLRSEKNGKS